MIPFLVFVLLVWIGLPLAAPLIWAASSGMVTEGHSPYIVAEAMYRGLDNLPLTAIVGFVLAGGLMSAAGLTEELTACARKIVGRATGGLALVTILACLFFSCLSGSGGATCAAVGAMMIPTMIKAGYPKEFAGAMAATGGCLGILLPPSIPMIIFSAQANVPTDRLFLAGVFPGLVLTGIFMLTAWVDAKRRGLGNIKDETKLPPFWRLMWRAKWSLAMPVIILGGIWSGICSATEAAVVAIFWALTVGLVRRKIKWSGLLKALTDTSLLAGGAVILLAPATALARYLAIIGAPQMVAEWVPRLAGGPIAFLFILAAVLFLCGLISDTISMIAVMTPIFLPAAVALNVDPIIMGLVFIMCCEAGFLTPPFGGNLFIVSRLANSDLGQLSVAVIPYVIMIMALTAVIILWPGLALWPVNFFK